MPKTYTPDENRAWHGVLPNSILNAIGIVIVALRLWSRQLTKAGFGWDDGFVLVGVILVNAMLGIFIHLVAIGFGLSAHEVPPENLERITELNRVMRLLFIIGIIFPKLSALFFYLRVFGSRQLGDITTSSSSSSSGGNLLSRLSRSAKRPSCHSIRTCMREPSQRSLYIFLIYFLSAWSIVSLCQEITACGVGEPLCKNQRTTDLGTCLFNAFSDVTLFVLPLWPIWRLKTKRSTKVGLSVVFLLGVFTLITAFQRFFAIEHTDYANDYSGTASNAATYAVLELNFSILAISLPMLLPVFRKLRDLLGIRPFGRSAGGLSGPRIGGCFTDSFHRQSTMLPCPSTSPTASRKRSSDRPLTSRDERLRSPSPRDVHEEYQLSGLEPELPLPVLMGRGPGRGPSFYGHES